jgi:iron complex outermembrane recepter protein
MIFAQLDLKLPNGWIFTAGVSLNKSSIQLIHLSSRPSTTQKRIFENKLPPHIAILKKITKDVSAYASIARGFSPPTVSEILRSDGLFGTNLQPEDGIDYEAGIKGTIFNNKLFFDISAFLFDLKNTIVQRIDTNGVFYYVNAGSTKQNGIEAYLSYRVMDKPDQLINSAKIWGSYSWHDFHYGSFKQLNNDYSKNKLPGVAPQVVVAGIDLASRSGCYINITYNYTGRIQLNDANSAYTSSYNLLGTRLGYRNNLTGKINAEIFAGADNLFDTRYSLGNDINAAAGRYYNAAPGRNYYAGLSITFNNK